jgi:hypothetical protein
MSLEKVQYSNFPGLSERPSTFWELQALAGYFNLSRWRVSPLFQPQSNLRRSGFVIPEFLKIKGSSLHFRQTRSTINLSAYERSGHWLRADPAGKPVSTQAWIYSRGPIK